MALIYNATFDSGTRVLSLLDKAGNVISSCEVPSKELVDDITKPLTFKATQDGSTVKLSRKYGTSGAFQTSRDGGNTWTGYSINTAITLNTGDEVSFRAKADRTSYQDDQHYFYFEMTGKIEAWHNVMSLYRTSDFATYNTVLKYAFYRLFYDCTSLTKAPVLPATTLDISCYHGMFWGCTSLTKSPALPATTLEHRCYNSMFWDCTSLTEAPELPATTLVNGCYGDMFRACTSLTKSPDLSATTFDTHCYGAMFYDCSSLNEVRCKMPSSYSSNAISVYAGSWLKGVSSTGTFYTNADANWSSGASGIPEGWRRLNIDEEPPTVDDITKPLTFRATQDGSTVKLKKNGTINGEFQTSTDGGNTWSDYTLDTNITLNNGGEVSFRAKADRTSAQDLFNRFYFEMTGKIEAWHNIMSLYRTNDFSTYNTMVESSFNGLFEGCTSLTKAPALPSTTLAKDCYYSMFKGCTSLTKAPVLPATTLAQTCYSSMFRGCASLTKAPELPATTLANYCYQSMFEGCTSLVNAPTLPATTLADYCYESMFKGCTSLVNAPVLPATTLANDCYDYMFDGCTSLTEAPALPATTLIYSCYYYMFSGCTSLTRAPELTATTLADYCYSGMFNGCSSLNEVRCNISSSYSSSQISSYAKDWLKGVSSTGTFYTNADANWSSGASGIPTGWTRVPEVAPVVDNIRKPLTFRATQDGSTVKLSRTGTPDGAFQTSRDGGSTWTDYTLGTYITLNTGDKVSFRAKADRTSGQTMKDYFYFQMTGKIEAWHNVMSLYCTNDFATYSLVSYAFNSMFNGCTSLTKAPKLPVTTLAHGCYRKMFAGCTSLTKPPALPETTLAVACYYNMFDGCTSLTEAPELPATTLASSCYHYMFYGCTSLTKTPALSATTLADSCYREMFRNCGSLNEVRCKMPSSYSSSAISSYAYYWLSGVSSKGTFYTNADANWPSGDDGIPQTWTRANIDDYPTT